MGEHIVILDYIYTRIIKIKLSEKQIKEASKYDNYEEYLTTLENKYGFMVNNCDWMHVSGALKEINY